MAKAVKLGKAKSVVVAPNIDQIETEGGLDDLLGNILGQAEQAGLPVVFALTRKKMGQVRSIRLAVVRDVGCWSTPWGRLGRQGCHFCMPSQARRQSVVAPPWAQSWLAGDTCRGMCKVLNPWACSSDTFCLCLWEVGQVGAPDRLCVREGGTRAA